MRARVWHLVLSVPAWFFLTGAAWSAFDIFILGHSDSKLGPVGTLQVSLLILAAFSGTALPGLVILAWVCRTWLASLSAMRVQLVAGAAAITTLILVSAGEVTRIADYLIRIGQLRAELLVYAIIGGLLPCAVLLIILALVRLASARSHHADEST